MRSEGKFSAREARALLWLLPVLAVVSWLVWEISRMGGNRLTHDISVANIDGENRRDSPPTEEWQPEVDGAVSAEEQPRLFNFDPNTIEYHDLLRLGFKSGEALGIIKYRERGKVFEIPEDFAACYQVSEAMYIRLEPYIRIGERFRLRTWAETSSSTERTTPALRATHPPEVNRLTRDVSETNIDGEGRRYSPPAEEWQAKSDEAVLLPPLVDLNTADSARLIAVRGIGPATVTRIIEYRQRLGGFAAVEQLSEIRGMTEQNYERITEQIYIDPAVIRKIDINFAPAKSLAAHPYIRAQALRKLLKERQLKGGWRTVEELALDDIFTGEELEKLGPYLIFN
jgi:competence ComEA-like helix-hairpin-helix protein